MHNLIKVTYFQRKPHRGFSFSLEYIFEDVRARLKNRIIESVEICSHFNGGILSKFKNIVEAYKRQRLDGINHITGEVHFLNLLMDRRKNVLTILDCGMMARKKGLSKFIVQWLYLKLPVKKATIVTAISEVTKWEVIQFTGCSANKIIVVPVAINPVFISRPKLFNGACPNILHIGVGPNKNLLRLIEALANVKCKLTIIGKLNQEQADALNKHSISYLNRYDLSQQDLLEEYFQCDILSFVSTFEGFGMPIVEANSVERVVVTSNMSSMPEIAGDAACLVDPFDVQSIRDGILKVIDDECYRQTLIENGKINKLRFDGEKIADTYFEIYQRMAKFA